jgi:hypothetical protein
VRGCYDDATLAALIRDTIETRLPAPSRKKIMEYVCDSHKGTTTGKGMRFEALSRWPKMGTCAGMNLDRGHAIRLKAPYLKKASPEEITEVINSEQHAEGIRFAGSNECGLDVEERLLTWGFHGSDTECERSELIRFYDEIIRCAEKLQSKGSDDECSFQ